MTDEKYDKGYYLSHCGIPYHRDEPHWLRFFGDVAREINRTIAPKTVFDAGCAIGFLVETLREQGVEAFGRDISRYAIEQVPPGLRTFVECGSITDPIDGTFDLVTCIEVLEHMSAEEGKTAVENLCRISPRVFFSSSPTDFTEDTHVNVQPPIYWMRLFAEYGFGPVASFDGSFLCPWAILFERRGTRPTENELEAHARLILARMEAAEHLQNAAQHQGEVARHHEAQLERLKQENVAEIERLRTSLIELQEKVEEHERDHKRRQGSLWLPIRRIVAKRRSKPEDLKAQEEAIRTSGLFDVAWYLKNYPDVAAASVDAVHHYFTRGADEGRNPNPLFDTSYYVATHPEVLESKLNPLFHYLTVGATANLSPSADFDPVWYREAYPDAGRSNGDAFLHFLRHGRFEGRRGHSRDYGRDVTDARLKVVKTPTHTAELVLFVTHAPAGLIKPHVLIHVGVLRQLGMSVCVIVAADDLDTVDTDALVDHVDGLLVRENGGFDFAAWAHASQVVDLSETQLLVLTNDSILGPFDLPSMQRIADKIRASDAELVGLTDNREIQYHFQSYFLAAKDGGVQVLADFLSRVRSFGYKQDVITNYEVKVHDAFTTKGLSGEVLFPSRGSTNRTTTDWQGLIKEGFPFLKVEVLKTHEPKDWKKILAETGFDVQVAEQTLEIIHAGMDIAAPTNRGEASDAARDRQAATEARLAWLEQEITKARQQPWKLVQEKAKFWVYTALSGSVPLSAKAAAKYAEKARKRHPLKYMPNFSSAIGLAHTTAIQYPGGCTYDPTKPSILIVSHQASRTGAPIVALNVAQQLSERYNVTSICMTGGELMDDFSRTSERAYVAGVHSMNPDDYTALLDRVCSDRSYDFAIVNSVEAHAFLKGLRDRQVASVALLHEFASYTQHSNSFANAVSWADDVVFSSQLTLENAMETGSIYMSPRLHVLPQGHCVVPSAKRHNLQHGSEQERLRDVFRPSGAPSHRFVVLGAGTVEIRKGVDLFIEIATRVVNSGNGEAIHFVWVGAGYNPSLDFGYSAYLRDQMRRAGIDDRVSIIPATTDMELAYELSDLFLLSSRLDPLPNVTIDSMCRGLPVVCFDKASGTATLLNDSGLGEACVADYLDTSDLAQKVLKLGTSKSYYNDVSERTRTFAAATFDLARYVREIENLGLTAKARCINAEDDIAEIMRAGTFRSDFFHPPGEAPVSEQHSVRNFTRRLGSAVAMRKPEPGFDPFSYAALREGFNHAHDPYAAFLREGRPTGPWLLPVLEGSIQATQATGVPPTLPALHIHAYYLEELPAVLVRLKRNRTLPDLYVSVANDSAVSAAKTILAKYDGQVVSVKSVPNKGRDIGPLLTEFGRQLVETYDVVGHIHLKKSEHFQDRVVISNWNAFLLENLLGGPKSGAMVDLIIDRFRTDDALGIVFPDDPNIVGWTRNREHANDLARRMGCAALPCAINFPVGTMFWMRAEVLRDFVELNLGWESYPVEPIDSDGTILHALERLFGVVPHLRGWRTMVTNVPGVTR